jgi:hypothetical protein
MFLLYIQSLEDPIWTIGVAPPRALPVRAHCSYATEFILVLKKATYFSFKEVRQYCQTKIKNLDYILGLKWIYAWTVSVFLHLVYIPCNMVYGIRCERLYSLF